MLNVRRSFISCMFIEYMSHHFVCTQRMNGKDHETVVQYWCSDYYHLVQHLLDS